MQGPCEEPNRLIADILLDFVARAEAERKARLHFPIVLEKQIPHRTVIHFAEDFPPATVIESARPPRNRRATQKYIAQEIRLVITRFRSFPEPPLRT